MKKIILFLLLFIGLNISYSPQVGYNLSAGTEAFGCEEDDDSWWDEVDDLIESGDIEYNEWSSTEDFFTFADPEVVEDVFESLIEMGFDSEHIETLIEEHNSTNSNESLSEIFFGNDGLPAGLDERQLEAWIRTFNFASEDPRTETYFVLSETILRVYTEKTENTLGEAILKTYAESIRTIEMVEKGYDTDGNGIFDRIQDMDGNKIFDCEEPYDPNEFEGDELDSNEGSTRDLAGQFPEREVPLNLPTDAEKNAYIMNIVKNLNEKLQAKLGADFVPFPKVYYENSYKSYAATINREIHIRNDFFKLKDNVQIACVLHEWKHYYNEVKGINPMRMDNDGNIFNVEINLENSDLTILSPSREYSVEIKEYIQERLRQDLQKDVDEGFLLQSDLESKLQLDFQMLYTPKEITKYTYYPSNRYKDEIACYNYMLEGHEDGWFTLTETEILEIKYNIETMQRALENALKYEEKYDITPSGENVD